MRVQGPSVPAQRQTRRSSHDRPDCHGPGHGLLGRQKPDRGRALSRLRARGPQSRALQGAEHVEQRPALPSGGEIGRAQALQALAAGVEPDARMNPVLLKPEGDTRSQVISSARPTRRLKAEDYRLDRAVLWKAVTESLDSLRSEYDLVVIEGAGSPAEINLKAGEIVNMAVARYAKLARSSRRRHRLRRRFRPVRRDARPPRARRA